MKLCLKSHHSELRALITVSAKLRKFFFLSVCCAVCVLYPIHSLILFQSFGSMSLAVSPLRVFFSFFVVVDFSMRKHFNLYSTWWIWLLFLESKVFGIVLDFHVWFVFSLHRMYVVWLPRHTSNKCYKVLWWWELDIVISNKRQRLNFKTSCPNVQTS